MTDARRDDHQRLIDELLQQLADDSSGEVEESYVPNRGDAEALVALTQGLDRVQPPSAVWETIEQRVRAESRSQIVSMPERPSASGPESAVGNSPWLFPLAASTLLSLSLCGWLFFQMQAQRQAIADLSDKLRQAQSTGQELGSMQAQFASTRSQLELVTSPGVEVCPLRPTGRTNDPAAEPQGVLYVAADHQHWYLSLHNLEPLPTHQTYQLWFLVDEQPINAGTFVVSADGVVYLGSDTMPKNTSAVAVTREPQGGVEQPTGEPILFGDEVMRIL